MNIALCDIEERLINIARNVGNSDMVAMDHGDCNSVDNGPSVFEDANDVVEFLKGDYPNLTVSDLEGMNISELNVQLQEAYDDGNNIAFNYILNKCRKVYRKATPPFASKKRQC